MTTLHAFKVGDRVKLARLVDRFPDFIAPAGLTGTVHDVADNGALSVQMDAALAGAEDWDNCICWDDWQVEDLAHDVVIAD